MSLACRLSVLCAVLLAALAQDVLIDDELRVFCDSCDPSRPNIRFGGSIFLVDDVSTNAAVRAVAGLFDGYRIGMQKVNKQGGVVVDGVAYNLELIAMNSLLQPDNVARQVPQLVEAGAKAILSDIQLQEQGTTNAVLVAEANQMPFLGSYGATRESIDNPYHFNLLIEVGRATLAFYDFIDDLVELNCITPRIAYLHATGFTQEGIDALNSRDNYNTDVIPYEFSLTSPISVEKAIEIMAPLKDAGYNIIFVEGTAFELFTFGVAKEQLGITFEIEVWPPYASVAFAPVNGLIFVRWWSDLQQTIPNFDFIAEVNDFELKYEPERRLEPESPSAIGFQWIQLMGAVIEETQSLVPQTWVDQLRRYTESSPYESTEKFPVILPGAKILFDERGASIGGLAIDQHECDDDDDINILFPPVDATVGGFGKLFYSCRCQERTREEPLPCPEQCPAIKALNPYFRGTIEEEYESSSPASLVTVQLVVVAIACLFL